VDTLRQKLRDRSAAGLDVVGVGECSLDEVWVLPGPLAAGGKLRAVGRDRLGGGQIATAMVACARLGLRTAFAGVVGDDHAGSLVTDGLRREGVDVAAMRVVPGGATREALILVDAATGERMVVEHLDKKVVVPHGGLPEELIARARVLHVDATQIGTSLAAARLARQHGVVVSIDVDHVGPGLDELLALSDLCIMSEGLPQALTGEPDLELALRAVSAMTRAVVGCTLGRRGAAALDNGHLLLSPAFETEVVDTTACGDTFRAAMIRAMLDEKSVGDALRFANAAAGLKCRALGRVGCPTKSEVDELLARV
jgi:sulfofructose kinase